MDPDTLPPYQYTPLPSARSTRLLELPSDLTSMYRLQTVTIGQHLPYKAVSYTWGSPLNTPESIATYEGATSQITITDPGGLRSSMTVGRNAFEALARIRSHRFASHLWIDAICINQADQKEKEGQIPLMGEIFMHCEAVLVWLGESDKHLQGFLDFNFGGFGGALLRHVEKEGEDIFMGPALTEGEVREKLGVELDWGGVPAYREFYACRRWFTRGWVVQEVALAWDVEVLCAGERINFSDMYIVGFFMLRKLRTQISRLPRCEQISGMYNAGILRVLCLMGGPNFKVPERTGGFSELTGAESEREKCYAFFQYVLLKAQNRQSTLPHDAVYSVLGLFRHFLHGADVNTLLTPDYSLSPQTVFTQTAFLLAQQLPSLSVLSIAGAAPKSMPGLPTWVPDFATCRVREVLSKHRIQTKSRKPQLYRELNGCMLILYGSRVGNVADFADLCPLSTQPAEHLPSVLRLALAQPPENGYDTLWMTMLCDVSYLLNFTIRVSRPASLFRAFLIAALALAFDIGADYPPPGVSDSLNLLNDLRARGHDDFPSVSDVTTSARTIAANPDGCERAELLAALEAFNELLSWSNNFNRRLLLTAGGELGLGPVDMRIGDGIWELEGAPRLYVLREVAGKEGMELIGEAYLHEWELKSKESAGGGVGLHRIVLV